MLASISEGEGVDAVIVHARTRTSGFSGPPDLETLAEVVRAVKIPVIGNGGVNSPEDAKRMMERTGCAGVMIARAARGNPWIFAAMTRGPDSRDANPANADKARVILLHLEYMCQYTHEHRAAIEMRKHLSWYSRGLENAVDMRRELHALETRAAIEDLVQRYFLARDRISNIE